MNINVAEILALKLYDAVRRGQQPEVKDLLEIGAQPDGFDGKFGGKALHWAARENHADIAAMLIDAGADVSCTDRHGIAPSHFAHVNGNLILQQLLQSRGAAVSKPTLVQLLKIKVSRRFAHKSAKEWVEVMHNYYCQREQQTKVR